MGRNGRTLVGTRNISAVGRGPAGLLQPRGSLTQSRSQGWIPALALLQPFHFMALLRAELGAGKAAPLQNVIVLCQGGSVGRAGIGSAAP